MKGVKNALATPIQNFFLTTNGETKFRYLQKRPSSGQFLCEKSGRGTEPSHLWNFRVLLSFPHMKIVSFHLFLNENDLDLLNHNDRNERAMHK